MAVDNSLEEELIGEEKSEELKMPTNEEEWQAQIERVREEARVEGYMVGAGTANHFLNNKLMAPMGFIDMALENPALPDNLKGLAEIGMKEIESAAAILQQMKRVNKLVTLPKEPNILDLEKSTAPLESTSEHTPLSSSRQSS